MKSKIKEHTELNDAIKDAEEGISEIAGVHEAEVPEVEVPYHSSNPEMDLHGYPKEDSGFALQEKDLDDPLDKAMRVAGAAKRLSESLEKIKVPDDIISQVRVLRINALENLENIREMTGA